MPHPVLLQRRLLVLVVIGAVVGAGSGVLVYGLARSRPPVKLSVTTGSSTGVIQGNFTNYSSRNALALNFSATTFANQTSAGESVLAMLVSTETYYDPFAGAVYLYADVNVSGSFASNLGPSSLRFTINETGPLIGLHSYSPPATTNLSFDSQPYLSLYENQTGNLSATLVNVNRTEPNYAFGLHPAPNSGGMFEIVWRPAYNHFVGFRASVLGSFNERIQVSVLLEIVDSNGGTWT